MTALLTHAGPAPLVRDERVDFDAFYAASYQRLTLQMFAFLGDRAEAEAVADEAFCRALAKWKLIQRSEDPVTWIRRQAWDLAAKRSRRTVTATDRMTRALATLQPADRRIVILHFMAHLTVAEIAIHERTNENTVAGRLTRGKAALASQLTQEGNL